MLFLAHSNYIYLLILALGDYIVYLENHLHHLCCQLQLLLFTNKSLEDAKILHVRGMVPIVICHCCLISRAKTQPDKGIVLFDLPRFNRSYFFNR